MLQCFLKVYLWLFLIVIANDGRTGYYRLFRINGKSLSDSCIVIRGMHIISLLEVPLSFLAVITRRYISTSGPLEIVGFLNNIIGAPVFMLILCGVRPFKFSELGNSGV